MQISYNNNDAVGLDGSDKLIKSNTPNKIKVQQAFPMDDENNLDS